jgi:TRAP-type mannitol/chloroaromatic compound transport system substrate-binding protein
LLPLLSHRAIDAHLLKWRCTALAEVAGCALSASETISKYVAEATDNKFQIQPFAGGEVVPALQAVLVTSNATVEMCHTAAYYFIGKDPTFALYCSVPFSLNSRQQNAWFRIKRVSCSTSSAKVQRRRHCGRQYRHSDGRLVSQESTASKTLNGLKMRIGG